MSEGTVQGLATRFRLKRDTATPPEPPLDRILAVAARLIEAAVLHGEYGRGTPGFKFGDADTVWIDGWPAAEWARRGEMNLGEGDDVVALRIFDPNLRESLHWFVSSADRRLYDATFAARGKSVRQSIEKDRVEDPLAAAYRASGDVVHQQVSCAAGRVDIHNATKSMLVECKADGGAGDIVAAAAQLRRYASHFPGHQLAIAVPFIYGDGVWLADLLREAGFIFIETEAAE
jgi:hypothetical protein